MYLLLALWGGPEKVGVKCELKSREGSTEEVGLEEGESIVSWAGKHHKPKQRE